MQSLRSILVLLATLGGLDTALYAGGFGSLGDPCSTLTITVAPYDGYAYVGSNADHDFNAEVEVTPTVVGQILTWYWTRNNTPITGPNSGAGSYTVNTAGNYTINSTYAINAPAQTLMAGDYKLVVESNCPGNGVSSLSSPIAIMAVVPNITQQPAGLTLALNASGNFLVTAQDGASNNSLTYQWYRQEWSQALGYHEVALGSLPTQAIVLTSLGLTGRYYAKIGHTHVGSARPAADYGQVISSDGLLRLNVPSQAALASQVCRTNDNNTLKTLYLDPNNPISGVYQIYEHDYLTLFGSGVNDTGLGSCSGPTNQAGTNNYDCSDFNAQRAENAKEYWISTTSSIIDTQYRYERNAAIIGSIRYALDASYFDDYYDSDPTSTPDEDGLYRARVTYVPCDGTLPGAVVSNAFNVDIISGSVGFSFESGTVQNPNSGHYLYSGVGGFTSNSVDLPGTFTAIAKGGFNFSVNVSASGGSITGYQWQRRADASSPWVNLPSDSNRYSGQTSTTLEFYADDEYGYAPYNGLTYTDAGDYRLSVLHSSGSTYTSQVFSLSVNPQKPFEILGLPSNSPSAPLILAEGSPIYLNPAIYPLDAINLNYSWQLSPTGQNNWATISTNSTLLFPFPAGTWDVRLTVQNMSNNQVTAQPAVGGPISTTFTVAVTPAAIAPSIVSQVTVPTNFTVNENGAATVTVTLGSSTTMPVTYQWQRKAPGAGTAFVDIGAPTTNSNLSNTLSLSDLTFANDNGAAYRARVTNIANSTGEFSNPATLTVNQAVCASPAAPAIVTPPQGSTNVSIFPQLSWTPVTVPAGCNVTYNVRLGTNTNCALNQIVGFGLSGTSLQITAALQPLTNYTWCTSSTVGASEVLSASAVFTTGSAAAEAPENLYTLPATSLESPAGNQQIIVGAYNGEAGATGIFYLKRPEGDLPVGEVLIAANPAGQFELPVNIATLGSLTTGPREFYARQRRAGSSQLSDASLSVIYYYDSSLSNQLLPPLLQKNGDSLGHLKWQPAGGYLSPANYRVYRRVGLEDVVQNDPRVKFQNKPYFLIPTPATLTNGWFIWSDPSVAASDHGVSYFVTTVSNDQESPRSNAVSFGDSFGPKRSSENEPAGPKKQRVQFVSLLNGESAEGYLCNIHPSGYFHQVINNPITDFYENSPDMIALIQVKTPEANQTCDQVNYEIQSQSISRPFDSLAPVTIASQGINNCLSVGNLTNLNPDANVCIKTCLIDNSGRFEQNCIESGSAFTFSAFDGISAVTPLEDGMSVSVEWEPPQGNGQAQQPLAYIVKASNTFTVDGAPIFNSNTESRQIDATETQMVFDGLNTDTTYCFSVTAIDEDPLGQGGGASTYLCTQTLNNKPVIQNLEITTVDPNQSNLISIEFQIIDRQSDSVSLTSIAFKTADVGQWTSVSDQSISGNSDVFATTAGDDSPLNSVTWDSLAYFSGHHPDLQIQLKFVDIQGNETVVETQATTAFYSGSRSASYARHARAGCATIQSPAGSRASSRDQAFALILMSLMGLGLVYLRRGLIQ